MAVDADEPADIRRNKHGRVIKKQCPKCENWIAPRGYYNHNIHCDAGYTNSSSDSEPSISDGESDAESDAEQYTQNTNQAEETQTLDLTDRKYNEQRTPLCPDCGSDGDLRPASDAATWLARNTDLGDELVAKVASHDVYCWDCHTAYKDSEVSDE